MQDPIFQTPPTKINNLGTKFWLDGHDTNIINRYRQDLPELKDFQVWFVQDNMGYRQKCVTHGPRYVGISPSPEKIIEYADIYRSNISQRNPP